MHADCLPHQVEDEGGASNKAKEIDIKKMDLEDLKAEIYRRESAAEEKAMELMVKKNERRREKIIERCAQMESEIESEGLSEGLSECLLDELPHQVRCSRSSDG